MAGNTVVSDDEDEVGLLDDEQEPHEAGRSRARVDDEDEDEEDEDGQDFYEKDGFIVDDEEEEQEEEEESDEERRKKKKRKKRESEKNYTLDEDDYELLEDNNIPGFHRLKAESKKFKRLKKAQRGNEEGHSEFYDEEEYDGSGKSGRTAEEKLKHSLFGDDEGQQLEDIGEYDERPEEGEDGDIGDDDEMADFIVEDDDDGHGAVVSRKKPNKKSRLGAPGVTSSAIQEAQDIFGDVDELLDRRKQGLDSGELKERRLVDEFEPIVLSEKYMTEKDDRIREIDIPERMQISEESTGPPPTDDITSVAEESSWINSQLATTMECLSGKTGTQTADKDHNLSITNDDVMRFLEFMHTQKLDVPFIAMYRKEEIQSLLKDTEQEEGNEENQDKFVKTPKLKCHKMLWVIQDLDRKWLQLQKRKNALRLYYQKRSEEETQTLYDETRLNLNRQLFESILNSLKTAESEKEVDDVDSKFNLHFPPGEVGLEEGQFKRPKRKSQYSICSKQGLWEVASKFGYSSEQFGSHISLANVSEELEDAKETPEEMASNFTCAMFETPQAVLKGARHMAAVEISYEPSVRKHVRSTFMDNAELTTIPTADGKLVIDSFHQFAGVKWLCNKPLTTIKDAQWLLIQKAEEEKLLKVTIKLPEASLNKLISDFNENYLSDGVSKSAQLWNEQRKQILEDAIYNFLLPAMEKESRSLLTTRAKMWLLSEYGKVLLDKVSVAPYQRKESDVNSDDEAAPKVMACCWGSGNPATTFVMLDSSGEVLDVLYTGSLTVRSQNVNDQQRKKNDQQRVKKFMTDHQPHVVVLGAANLYCPRLRDDIYEIIFKMVEDDPRDVDPEMDGISVVYGDESIPRLYENSRISSDQLPTQKGNVKRAVALGRYLQNPLAMITTLCGPGREITSWKLHSLDSFLTPDEKFGMVEQVLVDVTNQVGLDINLAASHEWLFAPLQFVAGLGPRKAASLQRSLVRAGTIFTRKDFVTSHGLGKKVFVNAVGFLRVRRSGVAGTSNQYIDLLDDTRIHPESYGLAQQLAKDIYKEQIGGGVNDDDDDEDEMEMAIEHVRDNPSTLRSINLRLYLETKKRLNKRDTFHDILLELIHGFQDRRRPYEEPNQDVEFYMISGETEDTLAEGRVVQATVRRVLGSKAFCSLDSGLTGILANFDYSDKLPGKSGGSSEAVDLTEKLNEGDLLTCTIKSIQKNRYQVDLCCKEGETKNNRYQNLDPFYREDQKTFDEEKEKARKDKELAKKYFKPRMIVHPRFQNITIDEATELLSDKEPGESIIRPSSRGPSFLTLTLKVYDSVYAHKDIVEGGKEHKDITSLLRIGKTLKIGEDTFEDLDEVMDRYVDPLVTHLKAMLCYRKFKKGSKAEVDELLKIEKAEFPLRIVYCFGISHEHPGTFILTYIRSSNPHHEYIGLYPKGFKFRKRMFEDIDRLVSYFQRHIDDPPQESALSMRSVAAMVPLRSPATGGSSGAGSWGGSASNNEGGWRDRSATPGSRPGRGDYRNSGRDGNSSGIPRPYGGRGRGRGRGSGDNADSDYGTPKWGSGSKKGDDGLSSFPGAKVRNSPGKEAFPGGWGSGGDGGGGGGGWGGGSGGASSGGGWGGAAGSSGWGSGGGAGDADVGNSGWGNSGGSGSNKNLSQAPSHDGWSGGGGGGW